MVTSITSNVRIRRSLFPAPSCKSVVVLSKKKFLSFFTYYKKKKINYYSLYLPIKLLRAPCGHK